MKKYSILLIAALALAWGSRPAKVLAQTVTPPPPQTATPLTSGDVSGKIIDQNQGSAVAESLEIMLHIWDQNNDAINMLHAQSAADGTYRFEGVDLQPHYIYAVMATFDSVTYQSKPLSPSDGSNELQLDVPVYETTKDTSSIQVDQMHVLFNFAQDGLETTEIYLLSNKGTRTVKDAVSLEDGKRATLKYPLPSNADYIFFQPDEQDRFIKFTGGFADTSPLLPGDQADQHAVQYLVPYSWGQMYSYTAPLYVKAMNFLLPQDSGVTLKGEGLAGPEPVTAENGVSYMVYTYNDIPVGQTIQVTFSGKPASGAKTQTGDLTLPLALGGGLLGLAMIGAGVWWWRRPTDAADEDEAMEAQFDSGEAALDEVIGQIAQLDEAYEQGKLGSEEHQRQRRMLLQKAKHFMQE